VVHQALVQDWAIRAPRIGVLGLNPHAGEGGDIGSEERAIVGPAIRQLQDGGMKIEGPFPADSFFGRYTPGDFDAVMAMYHDQGLIPLKMSSFGTGVNVTAGLPIVRTSPDHGTAFDIAGRGIANAGSMVAAIALAARIATNRRQRRM
jgi:4-hydroxythreonine-4-phosphate dehydrogenase